MTEKPRITHLLYSGLGGHGSVFFSLIKADEEKYFHTEAVFCGIENVRAEYIEKCKLYGIPVYTVRKKKGIDISSYKKIYAAFKRSHPHVIFLHGPSFILPAVMYAKQHKNVRIVLRDTQAFHLKTKMDWIWLRLAAKFASNIIFLTPEAKDNILERIGNPRAAGRAVVIPNGLDFDLYAPALRQQENNRIVIGMQSRLQPIKDHPTLLKAFALLKKQTAGKQIFLRIAGDGETMDDLRELALELDIAHEVEFCGMLNEADLLAFMLSLDIYVHATFGETMSNSIMQAMACGLPIVASDVWGVNNMITDNVNGLLYESQNAGQLCAKIAALIEEPALSNRLSADAREMAVEQYSNKKIFGRYKVILDQ